MIYLTNTIFFFQGEWHSAGWILKMRYVPRYRVEYSIELQLL